MARSALRWTLGFISALLFLYDKTWLLLLRLRSCDYRLQSTEPQPQPQHEHERCASSIRDGSLLMISLWAETSDNTAKYLVPSSSGSLSRKCEIRTQARAKANVNGKRCGTFWSAVRWNCHLLQSVFSKRRDDGEFTRLRIDQIYVILSFSCHHPSANKKYGKSILPLVSSEMLMTQSFEIQSSSSLTHTNEPVLLCKKSESCKSQFWEELTNTNPFFCPSFSAARYFVDNEIVECECIHRKSWVHYMPTQLVHHVGSLPHTIYCAPLQQL